MRHWELASALADGAISLFRRRCLAWEREAGTRGWLESGAQTESVGAASTPRLC